MNVERMRDEVEAFFSRWGGAGLKLPSGWFGRPYDNFHELTSVSVSDDTLVVVLDERQTLRLRSPGSTETDGSVLRVDGFVEAEWTWFEYDTDAEHRERFDRGTVEFVAE